MVSIDCVPTRSVATATAVSVAVAIRDGLRGRRGTVIGRAIAVSETAASAEVFWTLGSLAALGHRLDTLKGHVVCVILISTCPHHAPLLLAQSAVRKILNKYCSADHLGGRY